MDDVTDSMLALQHRKGLVPLGPWIALARRANVPHVPASFSPPFPLAGIWEQLDGTPCPFLEIAREWARREGADVEHAGGKPYIRWEDCSPGETKWLLGQGGGYRPEYGRRPMLDDPRLMDCMLTDPQRLVVRPWVDALVVAGYPVEFRVFYGPAGYQGVSSYYPQRSLPDTPATREWADRAVTFAAVLHDCDQAGGLQRGFSADFLVTVDGRILFLEGGPPHVNAPISAHPCAFPPGQISGVALAPRPGALNH